jgi:hypothetical protein
LTNKNITGGLFMQKNGRNQPLSSEIIADLEEKLMARNVIITILATALAVTTSRRKWEQNERGDKDNRRNICEDRYVCNDLLHHMDAHIIWYYRGIIHISSLILNGVSSYYIRSREKVNAKIK